MNAIGSKLHIITYKGPMLEKAKKIFIKHAGFLEDFVLLNSCERAEIYTLGDISIPLENCKKIIGEDAKNYLVSLASGMESRLIGEIEIYHQLLHSLEKAKQAGHLSEQLDSVFLGIIEESKTLREKTKMTTSWVDLIAKLLKNEQKIAILGRGFLAKKIYAFFKKQSKDVFILRNKKTIKNLSDFSIVITKDSLSKNEKDAIKNSQKIINASSKLKIDTKYDLDYLFRLADNLRNNE